MPYKKRDEGSGAIIFHKTASEKATLENNRKVKDLVKENEKLIDTVEDLEGKVDFLQKELDEIKKLLQGGNEE